MDDPILETTEQAPAQPPPAQVAAPVPDPRIDRLEQAMAQLAQTVQQVGERIIPQLERANPPQTSEQFLSELATNPREVIQREAEAAFQRKADATLNPAVLKVLHTASQQILDREQQKVDTEFGLGTFDELFRPQLQKDIGQLMATHPQAAADPDTLRALIDRLYGGDNFPQLADRRKALDNARARGMSHLIPRGGIPRLRKAGEEPDLPDDVEPILQQIEKATGERIDRKHYARIYHTGEDSGPGRHRTSLLEYLRATGASPDTLKMYGGERS